MSDVVFPGMRGTGDWTTDERDYSWREGILKMYPNGKTPITAILARLSSESCPDQWFNWFFRVFPATYSALEASGVYSDSGGAPGAALTADNSAEGTLVWLCVADSTGGSVHEQQKYRAGQHVVIAEAQYRVNHTEAQVTGLYYDDGTNYYFQARLMDADQNVAGHSLDDCDYVFFGGHSVQEGVGTVPSRVFDPSKQWNFLGINRTSWDATGSMLAQKNLRTGDRVKDAQFQALEWHSLDLEAQSVFGIRKAEASAWVAKGGGYTTDHHHSGAVGMRRRSGGLLFFFEEADSGAHLAEFDTSLSWLTTGENWLDTQLETLFRYGSEEKVIICGGGALLGLQNIIKKRGTVEMTQQKKMASYGMNVIEYETAFGTTYWKRSAVMTQNPVTVNWCLVLDTQYLKYRFAEGRDVKLREQIQLPDEDRELNEFLTEWGLELHFPMAHGLLTNVGVGTET